MPNLNPRRFSDPDTLRKIKRECLIEWLVPATEYFERRGVVLPSIESGEAVDYDRLADVFMEPEADMPQSLVDSLYVVHEMADQNGMDLILDAIAERDLDLEIGDDHEPADVAVQAWLKDKDLLENLHNQHQLTRPRSFLYFVTERNPVPSFKRPSSEVLKSLEARLDDWYARKKRRPLGTET